MNWYDKLTDYFPKHEMKDFKQLQALIENKQGYHLLEEEDYVLLYAEFPDFIFIDYLLVMDHARGQGVGSRVIQKLQEQNKLILLEAEPIEPDNEVTAKRIRFYEKNGFTMADQIDYTRKDEQGNPFTLKILYWAPQALPQTRVLEKMEKACQEIHNYRSEQYDGRALADPCETLAYQPRSDP